MTESETSPPATYESIGARILRWHTRNQTVVWSPEHGWHDSTTEEEPSDD